jgi:hypothetical protein
MRRAPRTVQPIRWHWESQSDSPRAARARLHAPLGQAGGGGDAGWGGSHTVYSVRTTHRDANSKRLRDKTRYHAALRPPVACAPFCGRWRCGFRRDMHKPLRFGSFGERRPTVGRPWGGRRSRAADGARAGAGSSGSRAPTPAVSVPPQTARVGVAAPLPDALPLAPTARHSLALHAATHLGIDETRRLRVLVVCHRYRDWVGLPLICS